MDDEELVVKSGDKRGLAQGLEESPQDTASDPYHTITNAAIFDRGDLMAP